MAIKQIGYLIQKGCVATREDAQLNIGEKPYIT